MKINILKLVCSVFSMSFFRLIYYKSFAYSFPETSLLLFEAILKRSFAMTIYKLVSVYNFIRNRRANMAPISPPI